MLPNKKELPKDKRVVVCLICWRQITSTFTLRDSDGDSRRPHPRPDKGGQPFIFTELENALLFTVCPQGWNAEIYVKTAHESSQWHFWACLSILFKSMRKETWYLGLCLIWGWTAMIRTSGVGASRPGLLRPPLNANASYFHPLLWSWFECYLW